MVSSRVQLAASATILPTLVDHGQDTTLLQATNRYGTKVTCGDLICMPLATPVVADPDLPSVHVAAETYPAILWIRANLPGNCAVYVSAAPQFRTP